jgi:hypothetical protein
LPRLFVADMGVAHGGADISVAEELLDFPQILSHVTDENDSDEILTDSSSAVMPSPRGRNSDVPQHPHAPSVTELTISDQSAIGADTISIRAN